VITLTAVLAGYVVDRTICIYLLITQTDLVLLASPMMMAVGIAQVTTLTAVAGYIVDRMICIYLLII
jgi:hypothetical protein